MLNLLLSSSAFVEAASRKTKRVKTFCTLDIAAYHKNKEVCKALLVHDADISNIVYIFLLSFITTINLKLTSPFFLFSKLNLKTLYRK